MKKLIYLFLFTLLTACSGSDIRVDEESNLQAGIFPDYADCTIPPNIAPLNFRLENEHEDAYVVLTCKGEKWQVKAGKRQFSFSASKWKKLLEASAGENIEIKIIGKTNGKWIGYKSFSIHVAPEPVDSYIAYRLIEPGYELWCKMGIYQRNLENYKQSAVIENEMTNRGCINCHSFCMQNPEKMLLHLRSSYAGTLLIDGDKVEKLNTKTDKTISALVYPSWHPSGRYVAFSVNDTKQAFHLNDRNRVEVFDSKSDVVVYDTEKHEVFTCPRLSDENRFETFPTFSPDGKTLYFCSAVAVQMPAKYEDVKYSLCSIAFNPESRSFGTETDTLYNAGNEGKSVSFPRVSPDGKYLLYTLSGYGNFSIWHKDADLYRINLSNGEHAPLSAANSPDVDSYHSWSSNSRWIIFSSRRIDGLYTRPYIAYINADGQAEKPFLLPQKDVDFYLRFMKSYNIPEFITGKISGQSRKLWSVAREEKGIDVKFATP